jgi:hypothetical protein
MSKFDYLAVGMSKECMRLTAGCGQMIRFTLLTTSILLIGSGCANQQLRFSTLQQTSTQPEIQEQQVLKNFARLAANSGNLPYYALATTGTISVNDAGNTSLAVTAVHKAFPTWSPTIFGLSRSVSEAWQTSAENNPDRLKAMRAAYLSVVNPESIEPKDDELLQAVLQADPSYTPRPGWISVGTWWDIPKRACMVSRCGSVYVWVMPEHVADFSRFVLLVLHLETVLGSDGSGSGGAATPNVRPALPASPSPFAPRLFDQPPAVNSGLFFVPRGGPAR